MSLSGGQSHAHRHRYRAGRDDGGIPEGVCALSIRGIPKSGTTWMEVVLERMLTSACAAAPPCAYSGRDSSDSTVRGGLAAPLPSSGNSGNCTGVRFVITAKHRIAGALLSNFGHENLAIDHADVVAGLVMERCVDRGIPAHSRACIEAIEVLDIGADRLAGVDESQMRYFNIMRDPRAVAVSACHYFYPKQPLAQCRHLHPTAFAANVAVLAVDWAYWGLRHPATAITMHYESIKAAPHAGFARLAEFLGIALTRADIAALVSATSAEEMAHLETRNRHGHGLGVKVRGGSRWGFLAELDTTMAAALNATMTKTLPPELLSVYELDQ